MRHAEALHNEAFKKRGRAAYEDPCFLDPELTALGVQQCRALKPQAARVQGSLDLLVVSPLRRTLETAVHTFDKLEGTPWVAHELVRERIGRNTCDRRRVLSIIKAEHPAVNFSQVRCSTLQQDDAFECLGPISRPRPAADPHQNAHRGQKA